MPSDNNWLLPIRNQSWNVFNDDWLTKHCAIENISDCPVWTLPHLLQFKLFDSGLIRSNGGTFYAYFIFLNSLSCVNSDLIVSGISMLNAQVIVLDV